MGQNRFDRIAEMMAAEMRRQADYLVQQFGQGQPFDSVKLNTRQKAQYWQSLGPGQQQALWETFSPEEQQQFERDIAPLLGGGPDDNS